jgi:acetyl esterase/lipase
MFYQASRNAVLTAAMALPALCAASGSESAFADVVGFGYRVKPNITYSVASSMELKLDLYLPRDSGKRVPALVYFHGGGWVDGSKERSALLLMPYLQQGWAVVNVEYRLAKNAPAPAAVEDARCALRWVQASAAAHRFDTEALVVAGDSAGGQLALAASMLPDDSPYDRRCSASDSNRWNSAARSPLKVAAVINWFGVTDVNALLEGPDARHFAIEWFGSAADRAPLATSISPVAMVRVGVPPVISVHGTLDPVVPYAQATALHAALDRNKVVNELVTVDGANHGGFTHAQVISANARIRAFLAKLGLRPAH